MDFGSIGKKVLQEEIISLQGLYNRFDSETFSKVVELLANHKGKVVFSGIGKSGYIARKLSSTFNSTGTRSVYLHPCEALHGDLGIYSNGDPTIILSRSGTTQELLTFTQVIKPFNSPIIAMIGNLSSPLARLADFVLDASIQREADPLGFVPTSSTTVALALGDALASALMVAHQFTHEDFLQFHPGGQLGKTLGRCVGDLAHPIQEVACVNPQQSLKEVVVELTLKPLGAALVMDGKELCGLITDGDIRRAIQSGKTLESITASDMMTANPISISKDLNLEKAIQLMEDRPHQLSVLLVLNPDKTCYGLFRLHDAYGHVGK